MASGEILIIVVIVLLSMCVFIFYRHTRHVTDSKRAIAALERLVHHDSLTKLKGRTLLISDVEQLINRGAPFFLVFMDLNRFKQVNDTFGHTVGDAYLAYFARETKSIIGEKGSLYRIGGDEFVGIIIGILPENLLLELEQLNTVIDGSEIPFWGISYGVAAYPEDAGNLEELIKIADQRMYEMKSKSLQDNR